MKFSEPRDLDNLCWQLREADYPRAQNRTRIDELFNGFPPYTPEEVEQNQINVNVNFLESTRLAHDGRSQFYNAFLKPGNFFTCTTDAGPVHKRQEWASTFTKGMNKIMKRSLPYFEGFRSKFALNVLHGISPSVWPDQDAWCPSVVSIGDTLVPSGTYLTMKNLSLFAIPRALTVIELLELTQNEKTRDPGWKMENVRACIEWADKETSALLGSNWPEVWAPEKMEERIKGDGGYYYGDKVPTIDVFDFYFYDEDKSGGDPGWRRRMILDAWATPAGNGMPVKKKGDVYEQPMMLYSSGTKKFADKRENIVTWQFADLSAVAPFYFHSVRSLGFLLYAVCHLQNRLRCKFNEAVFENLMMLFKVKSLDDVQRALKLDLVNKGFVDESLMPLTAGERFQPNQNLIQLGLEQNSSLIQENSSSYTQNSNYSQGGVEKTKFQVMAETNAMTSLVSAGLTQAYAYQKFEYLEIIRRFCKPHSSDPDVKEFRAYCMRKNIPEKYLDVSCWDCEPERVMGAGNKTLEMTIAQQLMEWRQLFDPEPQRTILRDAVLAITDDPGRADMLVPERPVRVTDSIHDAQLAAGTLMQGLPVGLKTGMNHVEYAETLMVSMATILKQAMETGIATPQEIIGLQNMAQHIGEHIQIIAQDENQGELVKELSDKLSNMMNEVRALQQRLEEHHRAKMEEQQNGNGQMSPEAQAKIQATMMTAKAKEQNTRESHAQRTVQRQIQFEQQMRQDAQRNALELQKQRQQMALDAAGKRIETQENVRATRLKATQSKKQRNGE